MSTRSMIAVRYDSDGPYALYYRHCDGYPTGLGRELIERLHFYKDIDSLLKEVGAEKTKHFVDKPEDAFLKVQGDLEWIYVIELSPEHERTSLSICRTSNPITQRRFVFRTWHSYLKYIPYDFVEQIMRNIEFTAHIVLQALAAFESAAEQTVLGSDGSEPAALFCSDKEKEVNACRQ